MTEFLFCTADCNPQYRRHNIVSNDTDDETEYDIDGEEYDELLTFCRSSCQFFSFFYVSPSCSIRQRLKPYEAEATKISSSAPTGTVFYRVCSESVLILTEELGSLFSYFYSEKAHFVPEDLTFYRQDGSILLSSVTHDGYCTLSLTEKELKCISLNQRWQSLKS